MRQVYPNFVLAVALLAWGESVLAATPVGRTGYHTAGGIQRRFWLHMPHDRRPVKKAPLVLALHGGRGTSRGMAKLSACSFDRLSDRDGFVVLYPDGVDKQWNDGRSDPPPSRVRSDVDDVAFLLGLIDRMKDEANIDPENVFCCGISNGGFMSFRLAREAPDRVRAIASVAANVGAGFAKEPPAAKPVSVLLLLGTHDPLVPFGGGDIVAFGAKRGTCLSAADSVKYWTGANACAGGAVRTPLPDTDPKDGTQAYRSVWSGCKDGVTVEMVTVQGGGHTWPGGMQYLPEMAIGRTSRDFDAAEIIWEFFRKRLK